METYNLARNAHLYHFDTGPFNWYVIAQGGRLTLVDAGFPGHYAIFRSGIQTLGYTVADVEAIILTHAHADHLGFAQRVHQETNAPIFIHEADQAAAQQRLQLPWYGLLSNAWRPYTFKMLLHATINGVFTMPRIIKIRTFKDGEQLDIPGMPHVIHVPGHTPGEVAFYLPESSILLSGDTLVTRNLLSGETGQPRVISPVLTDDYRVARQSIGRFCELGELTLLPGHGQAWTGSIAEAVHIAQQA